MKSQYMDRYVFIQIIILIALVVSGLESGYSNATLKIIGLITAAVGAIILAFSMHHLGASMRPVVSPAENAILITSGMYSVVRHPIYTGVLILGIAWSIFFGSLLSLLFTLVLFLFFMVKSTREEELLAKKFPEYVDYKTRVKKKIIPFVY